jgi:putative endonuclease
MSDIVSIIPQERVVDARPNVAFGQKGEKLAVEFLERAGYRIVMTNFTAPVGRNSKGVQVTGEIDIIALDEETLCFIEVKTRRSDEFAEPLANVDLRKQRQIARTAKVYRRLFNIQDRQYRFDVVSVLAEKGLAPTIELFRGFWNEAKFRKRNWDDVPY